MPWMMMDEDIKSETPEAAAGEGAADAVAPSRAPGVAEGGTAVEGSALSQEELDELTPEIVKALKSVYDPEIPADIFELGLIYNIDIADSREVSILMTLTAPGCPVAGEMPIWVENAVSAVPGVSGCKATITFDPPWDQSRMSDEARLALNMF
jgi:FeS assembly SUF system protein